MTQSKSSYQDVFNAWQDILWVNKLDSLSPDELIVELLYQSDRYEMWKATYVVAEWKRRGYDDMVIKSAYDTYFGFVK